MSGWIPIALSCCEFRRAIVPETFNVLLNPEHPDAGRLQVLWHEQYPWDARLFR